MTKSAGVTFSSLDPSQKNAFTSIVRSPDNLHVVYGPPGTGKSQLVVSLLERLAADNKKVLFVSQNIEALKVIERMIKRTENSIGYPADEKYVSLLDFCLMLYKPTHRQLKHLREQYSSITAKQLPYVGGAPQSDTIKYALQYINLNHEENYNVRDEDIGFDELVGYYIRYVKSAIAPEPLRSFSYVNVRGTLSTLDKYKNRDYFSQFNKPRRELMLLSTKNPNLNLPDVRNSLQDIREKLAPEPWMSKLAVRSRIDVVDYLVLIKEYFSVVQFLDIYRISTGGVNLSEIKESLGGAIDAIDQHDEIRARYGDHIKQAQDNRPFEVKGISHDSPKISLNTSAISVISRDITELENDKKAIESLAKTVAKAHPDIAHIGIRNLLIGLIKSLISTTEDHFAIKSPYFNLTSSDIEKLSIDAAGLAAQSSLKRMVSGVPAGFKNLLGYTNVKEVIAYHENLAAPLASVAELLGLNSDLTLKGLLDIASLQSDDIPLSRMGIKKPSTINDAVDSVIPVYKIAELLEKYDINIDDFSETIRQLAEFNSSTHQLQRLIEEPSNRKYFINESLEAFIESANICLDIEQHRFKLEELSAKTEELVSTSYRSIGHLIVNAPNLDTYKTRVKEVFDFLQHKESGIAKLIDGVHLPDTTITTSSDIDSIIDAINAASLSDNFSDFFFEIGEGKTLQEWISSVSSLESYNNDAEIVDFIEHNKAIYRIRTALGSDNRKYIDSILENDISFDDFAARIVNAVVGESFGRAPIAAKRHIRTHDIVTAYDDYLNGQKTLTYKHNLSNIHRSTIASAKELSRQSTLQAGGKSTMDKFRHNTNLISSAFPIICATPRDVSKYIATTKEQFDYVLFDEASQLLPGQALPSIYRSKKAVIIGDPHQMPPNLNASIGTLDSAEDEFDDLGESILDLVLKQPQTQHHLKVHYRSRYNKLFEPSREAIYQKDGIEPIFEAELANGAPIDIIDDLGDTLDENGLDNNFHKICEGIEDYLDEKSDADFCVLFTQVTILSKFKDFLAVVAHRKYKRASTAFDNNKVLLSTVTNCQGIEGSFTIIYMHHYSSPGAMWFFNENAGAYKRLNVSITRQREGLKLLLADPRSHWIRACDNKINQTTTGPNALRSAKLMRSLLTGAGEQADASYLDRKLGTNVSWFDSPLTERLYEKLTDHYADVLGRDIKIYSEVGWNLLIPNGEGIEANERNVGFRIDLGIYSIPHKKFILGIEMDGAMYHSGYDKEQSDYIRQKVLESKGWELYRIWSTNWLNDGELEFSKLVEKIDNNFKSAHIPKIEPRPVVMQLEEQITATPAAPARALTADGEAEDRESDAEDVSYNTPHPARVTPSDREVIELDAGRRLIVSSSDTRVLLEEEVKINGNDPIVRTEINIPRNTASKFTTALIFAITSPQVRKIVDAQTHNILITGASGKDELTLGVLYGGETEPQLGNFFAMPRIAAQKLKGLLDQTSARQHSEAWTKG